MPATVMEFDFIEEIRLRTWARENYCSADERDESWHPVILNEMRAKDEERELTEGDEELVVQEDLA